MGAGGLSLICNDYLLALRPIVDRPLVAMPSRGNIQGVTSS